MCARYERPKNWELRYHARRIRLRSHDRPVGSAESRSHRDIAVAANQPLRGREPDCAWTRCYERRCAGYHAERPQGADPRFLTTFARSGGVITFFCSTRFFTANRYRPQYDVLTTSSAAHVPAIRGRI